MKDKDTMSVSVPGVAHTVCGVKINSNCLFPFVYFRLNLYRDNACGAIYS